jgi:hypothetical protein
MLGYFKLKSLIQWKIKRDTRRCSEQQRRRLLLVSEAVFLELEWYAV